jgi:peptidoglycan/xylan/chitin deacetylase (PgdA/CDA1 family)
MYHRVDAATADSGWGLSVDPARFEEHLAVIREVSRPIRLMEVAAGVEGRALPRDWVAVTFDDGYRDNLDTAKPLLERYAIPATVFIASAYLDSDRPFWWDEVEEICLRTERLPDHLEVEVGDRRLTWSLVDPMVTSTWRETPRQTLRVWPAPASARHALFQALFEELQPLPHELRSRVLGAIREAADIPPAARSIMTSEEVLRLVDDGLLEVGAHTVTHPILTALPSQARVDEIRGGKDRLEELLRGPIECFAYPHGRLNRQVAQSVRDAGITCAVTTVPRAVRTSDNPLRLPRLNVENWSGEELMLRLSSWGVRRRESHLTRPVSTADNH